MLTPVAPLVFGRFVSPAASASIEVDPFGNRSCYLITCLATPPAQAASFIISGDPGSVYSITVDESVYLSGGGSATMMMDQFVDSKSGVGVLDVGGTDSFSIGATLNVSAEQAPDDYSGNFNVIIHYQ